MKSIILFCSLIASPQSFVTSHNFNIVCEDDVCFSKSEIEAVTNHLIDTLIEEIPEKYSYHSIQEVLKNKTDIVLVKKEISPTGTLGFECDAHSSRWCSGTCTINKKKRSGKIKISVNHEDCIAKNVFSHELIHFFSWAVVGDIDRYHKDTKLWGCIDNSECMENSVLYKANIKSLNLLCR